MSIFDEAVTAAQEELKESITTTMRTKFDELVEAKKESKYGDKSDDDDSDAGDDNDGDDNGSGDDDKSVSDDK